MDARRVLDEYGGAARLETLLASGVTESRLRREVAGGHVVRPLRGCYALPHASRAAILRAAYRAELCCLSLCEALKLPIIAADPCVHLVVPRDRARRATDKRPVSGVTLHRLDTPGGSDSATIAVGLDLLGRCADRMQQIVALDAALNRGFLARGDIADFTFTEPHRRQWLMDMVDPRAESLLETILRVALVERGFEVRPQFRIASAGRVDLVVSGKVVVQTDGTEHHSSPAQVIEDKRRDRVCVVAGYRVLRFSYADVMFHLDEVVEQITAALAY